MSMSLSQLTLRDGLPSSPEIVACQVSGDVVPKPWMAMMLDRF